MSLSRCGREGNALVTRVSDVGAGDAMLLGVVLLPALVAGVRRWLAASRIAHFGRRLVAVNMIVPRTYRRNVMVQIRLSGRTVVPSALTAARRVVELSAISVGIEVGAVCGRASEIVALEVAVRLISASSPIVRAGWRDSSRVFRSRSMNMWGCPLPDALTTMPASEDTSFASDGCGGVIQVSVHFDARAGVSSVQRREG